MIWFAGWLPDWLIDRLMILCEIGESMQPDGMLALMNWDEETPYMYFFKHGLDEEKVVSNDKRDKLVVLFATFPGTSTHVGPRIARIDPLHFLAECCKRWLNQALSVLSVSTGFVCILLFIKATFVLT